MTRTPTITLALAGFAILGAGAALWAQYGGLVFFDMLASSFIGCFI
jgi:hypothetical protein